MEQKLSYGHQGQISSGPGQFRRSCRSRRADLLPALRILFRKSCRQSRSLPLREKERRTGQNGVKAAAQDLRGPHKGPHRILYQPLMVLGEEIPGEFAPDFRETRRQLRRDLLPDPDQTSQLLPSPEIQKERLQGSCEGLIFSADKGLQLLRHFPFRPVRQQIGTDPALKQARRDPGRFHHQRKIRRPRGLGIRIEAEEIPLQDVPGRLLRPEAPVFILRKEQVESASEKFPGKHPGIENGQLPQVLRLTDRPPEGLLYKEPHEPLRRKGPLRFPKVSEGCLRLSRTDLFDPSGPVIPVQEAHAAGQKILLRNILHQMRDDASAVGDPERGQALFLLLRPVEEPREGDVQLPPEPDQQIDEERIRLLRCHKSADLRFFFM